MLIRLRTLSGLLLLIGVYLAVLLTTDSSVLRAAGLGLIAGWILLNVLGDDTPVDADERPGLKERATAVAGLPGAGWWLFSALLVLAVVTLLVGGRALVTPVALTLAVTGLIVGLVRHRRVALRAPEALRVHVEDDQLLMFCASGVGFLTMDLLLGGAVDDDELRAALCMLGAVLLAFPTRWVRDALGRRQAAPAAAVQA